MSIFDARREQSRRDHPSTRPSSVADDAMLRAVGVLVLFGLGAMHFLQIVQTFQGTPLLGAAYLVLIAASLVVAAALIRGAWWAWPAAGIVGAGAIVGYIFTRLLSTPLDNEDVGNWSCMLGLAALYVEASLILVSGYALGANRTARRAVPVPVAAETGRDRRAA
jgi:hypothetical protein